MTLVSHWEGEPVHIWGRMWGTPSLEIHSRIGSTSARARELAESGAPEGTLVLADEQTAGKGRSGKSWASPPESGLWFTLLLRPRSEVALRLVPLRVGAAVAAVLGSLDRGAEIGLKWPNDLWWREQKLAGILCERVADLTLVGIGLNLRPISLPGGARPAPVSLDEVVQGRVPRANLMAPLIARVRSAVQTGGPRLTPEELDRMAAIDRLRGRAVRCEPGPGGIARGLEPDGALRVETATGVRKVYAGSVRPLGPAPRGGEAVDGHLHIEEEGDR